MRMTAVRLAVLALACLLAACYTQAPLATAIPAPETRIVAQVMLTDWESHSHKVRVAGNIMAVNHERNMTAVGRRAEELPRVRRALTEKLGREPRPAELAEQLKVRRAADGRSTALTADLACGGRCADATRRRSRCPAGRRW